MLLPFLLKKLVPPRFPSSSYFIHQIFACSRPLLFSLFPFNFQSWCPSLFPSSGIYLIRQIFACGRPLLYSLFPFNFKSWCPSLFPPLAIQQSRQIFACGGPVPFHLFPFYLKSWCPPRFPSSSYFICQIFACSRLLLFFPIPI